MRILLISVLAATRLAAQQPSAEPIPRELALALIDRSGPRGETADIVVGRMPPSFPANAVPSGVTVLGGIERPPGAAVVLAFREPPDSTLEKLVRHLEREGWERDGLEPIGGFVPAAGAHSQRFCRGDASVMLFTQRRSGGGALAQLNSWRSDDNPACDENRRRRRGGLERVEIPLLRAPPDARMLGAGMGGSGRGSPEAFTRLEISMHPITLAAHYAEQLSSAGWTMTGPMVGEGMVVYGARRRDETKRMLGGVLLVLDVPATQQRDVVFRVATEDRIR